MLKHINNSIRTVCTVVSLLALNGCTDHKQSSTELRSQSQLQSQELSEKPNIILVMTDDQGYGDFGHNKNPIVKTPTIDQLAKQSIRLTDFHVEPTCSPTRAALMSGQYSLRAGVWHTVMGRHILSDEIQTLPEALKNEGYNTGMVGKWHLGDNYPFRPQDQGFEHVLIHGAGGVGQTPDHWGNTQFDDTYFLNGQPKKYQGYATDIWFNEAIDYIVDNAHKAEPFFLYVSTNAPHAPFRAPEKYIEPYLKLGVPKEIALFYAMITNLDENVARLRQTMDKTGITDNTIFIFMTDNGSVSAGKIAKLIKGKGKESIEKSTGQSIHSLNYDMRGAKNSAYEGGHRVPFYISWPNGGFVKPSEINGLSAHFDIMPTLLDLIDVDIKELDTDGVSLKSTLTQGAAIPERTLTVTTQRVLTPDPERPFAVMKGKWRYVKANGNKDKVELFDIAKDPSQTNDLIQQYPEIATELANQYQQWWQHTTSKGVPTMRSIIGSTYENPSRLTSHDWLAPNTKQVGHTVGFGNDQWAKKGWLGKETKYQISPWKVKTAQAGKYQFTIHLHDKPANKVIGKAYAHIELNGQQQTLAVTEGATHVTFERELDKGNLDIKAWFTNSKGSSDNKNSSDKALAAFYLYAELI